MEGNAQQSASAMEQYPSIVSAASTSIQPSGPQQDASAPAPGSHTSTTFDFFGPSHDTMPSFDPTNAAFAGMSFAPASTSLRDSSSLTPAPRQPECFHRADTGTHDKKRFKVDSKTPNVDSIDHWIRFDDDVDRTGSFEIDYSRRNETTTQVGAGLAACTMPSLGSGLYSTAMAPFREEDFIDDTSFDDQVLSDDEDVYDAAPLGHQLPDADTRDQHHVSAPAPLPPPSPGKGIPESMPMTWACRPQSGLRLNSALDEIPRQMRRDVWGAVPRSMSQVLSPEEQRHLEIALNSGQMPASFIPPNGFGLGFGAGLGARPPADFERRAGGPSLTSPETAPQSMAPGNFSPSDQIKEPSGTKRLPQRPAVPRCGPPKKPSATAVSEASKPRSADRVAHNDVERKYRTNLKVKIAELRDAVPTIQSPAPGTEGAEAYPGQQGGPKVSKRTVLTKATEYIQQLELRNKAIMVEHQQLARRLQAFETLFNSASRQPNLMANPSMTLFDPRGFC